MGCFMQPERQRRTHFDWHPPSNRRRPKPTAAQPGLSTVRHVGGSGDEAGGHWRRISGRLDGGVPRLAGEALEEEATGAKGRKMSGWGTPGVAVLRAEARLAGGNCGSPMCGCVCVLCA